MTGVFYWEQVGFVCGRIAAWYLPEMGKKGLVNDNEKDNTRDIYD
jgi:hypothetical protein